MSGVGADDVTDAVAAEVGPLLEGLVEDMGDDLGRDPAVPELLEVLSWALGSVDPALLSETATGVTIEPATAKAVRGGKLVDDTGEVAELGDAAFADALEVVVDVVKRLLDAMGSRPSPQDVCDVLAAALRSINEGVAGASAELKGLKARLPKGRTKRTKAEVGDVVAIPLGKDAWAKAVVVARNQFGVALGLLNGAGPLRPHPAGSEVEVDPQPVYTGESLIIDGDWKVIGHDDALRQRFPADPEIFHRQYPDNPNPQLGPFGSAETPDGALRPVTEEEALRVGLLDGSYRQHLSPQILRDILAERHGDATG